MGLMVLRIGVIVLNLQQVAGCSVFFEERFLARLKATRKNNHSEGPRRRCSFGLSLSICAHRKSEFLEREAFPRHDRLGASVELPSW